MPMKQVNPINPGHFQEVTVKALYEEFANRPEIKPYMPIKVTKGRPLQRQYFFDMVNTFYPKELGSILANANKMRNNVAEQQEQQE